jgi:hypothetical protein
MGLEFGVIQNSVSVGSNVVPIPKFPTSLIGIESTGIYAIAIVTPSAQYIVPFGSASGIVKNYMPVVLAITGNQLNTNVLAGGGTMVWLFGTPSQRDAKYPASAFSGAIGSLTTSQTSGTATGTITLTFPSGNLKATGLVVMVTAANQQAQVQFVTSTGATLTYAGYANQVGSEDLIVSLANFTLAQVVTLNVTTFAAMTAYVIIYYAP